MAMTTTTPLGPDIVTIGLASNGTTLPSVTAPSDLEVWTLSFACVTAINLCALIGVIFQPLAKKKFYKSLLTFMVALAIGVLTGSAVLILIPQSVDIHMDDHKHLTLTVAFLGILLFFNLEHILKMVLKKITRNREKSQDFHSIQFSSVVHHQAHEHVNAFSFQKADTELCKCGNPIEEDVPCQCDDSHTESHEKVLVKNENDDHTSLTGIAVLKKEIAPVAYMIIFGDGIHNFIDGLSIGASFRQSTSVGLSVSLAVFAEELPHELGDLAILLQSGMSLKQALLANFLSACCCYVGMIIGILFGELEAFAKFIYALAGGMFLYIALADMLPELAHGSEEHDHLVQEKKNGHSHAHKEKVDEPISLRQFGLQNFGICFGYSIILLLSIYAEDLTINI